MVAGVGDEDTAGKPYRDPGRGRQPGRAATTVLGPRLGAATLLALTIGGQMVAALLVDHYGVIGFPQSPVTPARLVGTVLLVAGVLLIMRR